MSSKRYVLISLLCLGLVVSAVILQQVGYQGVNFLPCPLCILQRVAYLTIACFCLLALIMRPFRRLFHCLATLSSIFGLFIASRQVWLISHPEGSCGIDPLEVWINQFHLANRLPWLFKADGLCSAQLPAIFGMQVPEWSLFWFGLLSIVLAVPLLKKSKLRISD